MKNAVEIEEFIKNEVQFSKKYYEIKIAETKEEFFKSLKKNQHPETFIKKLNKIWGNIEHSFMNEKIKELEKMVRDKDFKDAEKYIDKDLKKQVELTFEGRKNQITMIEQIYKLNPESEFIKNETDFVNYQKRLYENNFNSLYEQDKDYQRDYLISLVDKYNEFDATIPYFNADGTLKCYNTIATYNSMLYNVNLTKSAWNRTLYDSKLLNNDNWIIYPHIYSCPTCAFHQGKIYTNQEREEAIYDGVGHPNCKCVWYLYWGEEQLKDMKIYNSPEWIEGYKAKQKIQSLSLKRYRLNTDKKIYKSLNAFDEIDRVNQKIEKINSTINELKELLPYRPNMVIKSAEMRFKKEK